MTNGWECALTVHNRPGSEENVRYGFMVLQNGQVIYREQMSHRSIAEAQETAESVTYALMEKSEREESAKRVRMEQRLEAHGLSRQAQLVDREEHRGSIFPGSTRAHRDFTQTQRRCSACGGTGRWFDPERGSVECLECQGTGRENDVRSMLEKAGLAVSRRYTAVMNMIDRQQAELREKGIEPRRVYLSDPAYEAVVTELKKNAKTEEERAWWDRNPMGKISHEKPDGRNIGQWSQVYRLPDDLQRLDVVCTYGNIQEQHDIIKIKQKQQSEADQELVGVEQPSWEFLERRGIVRHEPEPYPIAEDDERRTEAPLDFNSLLKRQLSDPDEEDDDGA